MWKKVKLKLRDKKGWWQFNEGLILLSRLWSLLTRVGLSLGVCVCVYKKEREKECKRKTEMERRESRAATNIRSVDRQLNNQKLFWQSINHLNHFSSRNAKTITVFSLSNVKISCFSLFTIIVKWEKIEYFGRETEYFGIGRTKQDIWQCHFGHHETYLFNVIIINLSFFTVQCSDI